MYVRNRGYDAFPLMTEVTSIHAPKIMNLYLVLLRDPVPADFPVLDPWHAVRSYGLTIWNSPL